MRSIAPLKQAFRGLRRQRVAQGFANEDLIIAALAAAPPPDTPDPPWFEGVRRATPNEDQRRGTDLWITVRLEACETHVRRPERYSVPVNAKSSDVGLRKLAKSRHTKNRERRHAVPILGYVVDPTLRQEELRADFFRSFAANPSLRAWLAEKNLRLSTASDEEAAAARAESAQRKAARIAATAEKATDRDSPTSAAAPDVSGSVASEEDVPRTVARAAASAKKLLRSEVRIGTIISSEALRCRAKLLALAATAKASPSAREAVEAAVTALWRDPELRAPVLQRAHRILRGLLAARRRAHAVPFTATAPEAEELIGEAFGEAYLALRRANPELGVKPVTHQFMAAAKGAFKQWRFRAAKAVAQSAA